MRNGIEDEHEFAAILGLDWGDEQHEISIQDLKSGKVEECKVRQKPEDLHEWIRKLRDRFGEGKIAVAIEQAKGAVVYTLMTYDFIVIYSINPKSLARFREALKPSKAKSDRSDADLLRELVTKHRDRFRAWKPEDENVREMRTLVEYRRKRVNDLTRETKRLKSLLKDYFPQALTLAGALDEELAWDFLTKWPSLEAVKKAKPADVKTFYEKRRCRRNTIEKRMKLLGESTSLTTDQAIVRPSIVMMHSIIGLLRSLVESITKFEERIGELYAEHPDREVFDSFPGAGPVLAPRLTVAWGLDRSRYETADELLRLSGIAPVTEASGKSKVVHRSYGRPKFLHQSFFEYARQSIAKSAWARAFYREQRRLGHKRNHVLRKLAFKWIRIMFRCWKQRTTYNEDHYLAALEKSRSPLAKLVRPPASQECALPTP
jgi:transposase